MNLELELVEYHPQGVSNEAPLLFVHGACHGAWCWEKNFLPYFADKGFSSYAVSLRGHGESDGFDNLHTYTLQDYTDDVLEVIGRLKNKPVLIGHSMGGGIVQKILHQYPDIISGTVLVASIPPHGGMRDLFRLMFKNFKEAMQLFTYNEKRDASLLANVFFSKELPMEKKDEWVKLLQPESLKARTEMNGKIVPKTISAKAPMLVLGSKQDRMISEKTTRRIGKTYGIEPVLFPNISHDMMLDPEWEAVAGEILTFLNESISERRR